ncbi:acyltransferase [Pelagibacteraceae bacterium]|nr:acyltransferase [Pelagibacteraceae bacterium]
MKTKDYKPQIDGLRALAVLPVIFFHAGFDLFKGGFIGVDIFFVISGYLITNIIIKDLYKNKFSLSNFYIRRSRRILPVLFFVSLSSIIASIFFMSAEEIKFFSQQTISVVLFLSNFFFWKNSSYFDPNSELQPLLHTWSLGVEEQFYIFFPLLLILIWNFYKKKLVLTLFLISFLSLILSQSGGNFKIVNLSNDYPFLKLPFNFFWQAGSANFYLPYGRVWELLVGSLISIYIFKKKIQNKSIHNFYSFTGLLLIILSIVLFSEDLQYPSIFTILPVLGTSLIILYSNKTTLTYKLFSIKPLVFLGLISFSLYLWHQPLLAFNKIYFGINLTLLHTFILIFLSFLLSVFTWKYIEKPFRNNKIISDKKVLISLSITAIMILSISFSIFYSKINSIQATLPNKILKSFQSTSPKNCFNIDYAHIDKNKWHCEFGDLSKEVSFVVIGDSHALAIKPAFEVLAKDKRKKGILVGFAGCPGLLDINSIRGDRNIKNCRLLNEKLYKFIKTKKIKKIFLVSRWTYYTVGSLEKKTNLSLVSKKGNLFSNKETSKTAITYGIKNTAKRYKDLDVEVIFVHQVPEQIYDPKYVYQKSLIKKENKIDIKKLTNFSVKYQDHIKHQKFIKNNVNIIRNDYSNLKEIDFSEIFCNKSYCSHGSKSASYYADKNHLSISGAMRTIILIKDLLN